MILHNKLYYNYNSKRMKAVLVIAVITCVFIMGQAQIPNQSCVTRANELASCTSQLAPGGTQTGNFCNDCDDRLISYYRECFDGTQETQLVDAVQNSKLSSWL